MSDEPLYYDIIEQSRFSIKVGVPKKPEDLSDAFVTREELEELVGPNHHIYVHTEPGVTTVITFHELIKAECQKWADKLEASPHKSVVIADHELLEFLKGCVWSRGLGSYAGHEYCRHGDRIKYYKHRKRIKKTASKSDRNYFWSIFYSAFLKKFGSSIPYTPMYYRTLKLFLAYKKILGWRACRAVMHDDSDYHRKQVKFYRQIWDNPEEYYS